MELVICLNRKIEILRRIEAYGYQVAHYILQDEELAIEATKSVLLEVSRDSVFLSNSLNEQRIRMKQMIIRSSIRVKQQRLSGVFIC